MNRIQSIASIRKKLIEGGVSIGSWMQIPHASVAEIMGDAGFDWVAIDLEHGSFAVHQLPDLFRALELGKTLPLVRLARGHSKDCKQALDAGAGGVIIPMVESAEQLRSVASSCQWPPAGNRGVGFSRANLFGKHFEAYVNEAQAPLLVAQIEHIKAVDNLEAIIQVPGLDAIIVGPYDLSASMGITAQFDHPEFLDTNQRILSLSNQHNIPCGMHVVNPSQDELNRNKNEGYRFIAYSIDSVFLTNSAVNPIVMDK
jgi:2-dehydro-3-deoxyglucarate aldolase